MVVLVKLFLLESILKTNNCFLFFVVVFPRQGNCEEKDKKKKREMEKKKKHSDTE